MVETGDKTGKSMLIKNNLASLSTRGPNYNI